MASDRDGAGRRHRDAARPGAPVLLLKRNTFSSQYCDGKSPPTDQQRARRSPVRRCRSASSTRRRSCSSPGAHVDLSDANEFTAALLYPWFNIRRTDFYKTDLPGRRVRGAGGPRALRRLRPAVPEAGARRRLRARTGRGRPAAARLPLRRQPVSVSRRGHGTVCVAASDERHGSSARRPRWAPWRRCLSCARGAAALQGPSPGAASASTIKLPDGPGSVRGLADAATVNVFTAQVGYQIPIDAAGGARGARRRGWRSATRASSATGRSGSAGRSTCRWSAAATGTAFPLTTPATSWSCRASATAGGWSAIRTAPTRSSTGSRGKGSSIKVVQRNGRFEVTDAAGVRYFLGNSSASREEQDGRVVGLDGRLGRRPRRQRDQLHVHEGVEPASTWRPSPGGRCQRAHPVYRVRSTTRRAPTRTSATAPASRSRRRRGSRRSGSSPSAQTLRTYHLVYDETFALTPAAARRITGARRSRRSLPSQTFSYGGDPAAGV